MKKHTVSYTLAIEGNDIDAKNAKALKEGDALLLCPVADQEDTFEIVITDTAGKELDMLTYQESIAIAPFLREGSLKLLSATVQEVSFTEGKTRQRDITKIKFTAEFEYDQEILNPYLSGTGVTAFVPKNRRFYTLCLYRALDYDLPVITQTHLNRYEFEVDIDADSASLFNMDLGEENWFYLQDVLFNKEFTKCRIKGKIYCQEEEKEVTLSQKDIEDMLTFVNHYRIFNDEHPVENCTAE